MAWHEAIARTRVQALKQKIPSFSVQRFEDYRSLYEAEQASRASKNQSATPPLFSLPKGKAVVVDTVQIYVALTNYDEYRLEDGEETEASHERAMRLLHLYYSAADRTMESSAAQRVDFHSGRVHAVVLEQGNQGVTRETIAQALAFIEDFKRVADAANRDLANGEFYAAFSIGVDVGTCVAINNGTGCEQEPMFLGSAANYAAKLASGNEPGVFLSQRVHQILGNGSATVLNEYASFSDADITKNAGRVDTTGQLVIGAQDRSVYTRKIVEDWYGEISRNEFPDFTEPAFHFSHKEPPLSEIDYAELQPSSSIRMPLVSLFADLCGYTDYIDQAVAAGDIRDAVRALYVIRQEFQNVVETDFGGRKVRFIGDCIHAVIAEGSRSQTNERESVSSAVQCAGGLHSSFKVCKEELGNLEDLGLAVGVELGTTPISRIGIRGDRSVRVASSVATARSEQMQQDCEDSGVKLGPKAKLVAPTALEDLLDENGYSSGLDYDDVALCLSVPPASVSAPMYARAHVPTDTAPQRAHFERK